jgi:hypothetical protein
MSEKVFSYPRSCFSIQQASGTSVTIPNTYFGGSDGDRCSILFISQNTATPSVFVLGRKTVAGTIYEGNAIKQSDLSFNNDGSLTVTKREGLSVYFRVLVMEW